MQFRDKHTTKAGDIGEEIVRRVFENRGFIIYKADYDGSHLFDLVMVRKRDYRMMIVEVKTKPARLYRDDTGIDKADYLHYVKFMEKNPHTEFYLVWVDWVSGEAYGNFLKYLIKPAVSNNITYPRFEKNPKSEDVVYFALESLTLLHKLEPWELTQLKEFTARDPLYQEKYEEKHRRLTGVKQ